MTSHVIRDCLYNILGHDNMPQTPKGLLDLYTSFTEHNIKEILR